MYNGKDCIKSWKHVFINYFLHIFIVFLVVSFIAHLFQWTLNYKIDPLTNLTMFDWKETISVYAHSFVHLTNAPFGFLGGHMWFIYSYLFIVIFYPITWCVIKKSDDNFKMITTLIIIVVMLIYDVHMYNVPDHRFHIKYGVLPILYSYIGYNIKNVIVDKFMAASHKNLYIKYLIAFIVVYFIMLMTVSKYHLNLPYHMFYYESWLSGLALLSAIILSLLLYSLKIDIKGKPLEIVNFIAKNNIYIYLLHPYIIVLIYNYFIY